MTTNVHITRINDTLANLSSGLDSHQLAIRSDANADGVKALCWHDGTDIQQTVAMGKNATLAGITAATLSSNSAHIGGTSDAGDNNLYVDGRVSMNSTAFVGTKISTATGGVETIDSRVYNGFSWRPNPYGEADYTVTVTNPVEGQMLVCSNHDASGGFDLYVGAQIFESNCGCYGGILIYQNGAWRKYSYEIIE